MELSQERSTPPDPQCLLGAARLRATPHRPCWGAAVAQVDRYHALDMPEDVVPWRNARRWSMDTTVRKAVRSSCFTLRSARLRPRAALEDGQAVVDELEDRRNNQHCQRRGRNRATGGIGYLDGIEEETGRRGFPSHARRSWTPQRPAIAFHRGSSRGMTTLRSITNSCDDDREETAWIGDVQRPARGASRRRNW